MSLMLTRRLYRIFPRARHDQLAVSAKNQGSSLRFSTNETQRFAINFCFTYFLPWHLQPTEGLTKNNDNENLEDESITFLKEDLL